MLAARLLGRETRFELPERARVVLHSLNHYRLGLLESRTYPHRPLVRLLGTPHVEVALHADRYQLRHRRTPLPRCPATTSYGNCAARSRSNSRLTLPRR